MEGFFKEKINNMSKTIAKLTFEDGSVVDGESFGYERSVAGEVVFTTGMVGYPESLTDPSYKGQILVFTYPLIGNYGVPDKKLWESDRIHTTAIIVSNYIDEKSHHQAKQTLAEWLRDEKIPGIEITDTRALTQKIREMGTMLGKIEFEKSVDWYDPNKENLSALVSVAKPTTYRPSSTVRLRRAVLIDCGVKKNIIRSLVARGVEVTVVPWNYDIETLQEKPDGVIISSGPGDPKIMKETIANVKKIVQAHIPTLGICFGNQILTLAVGGDTKKMKFGHRSQNQPCECHTQPGRFYLTTQNHGFEVSKLPPGFKPWFTNVNDGIIDGIIHEKKPFMSVQFHPEACPGPTDTGWVFDYFLERIV